MYRSDEAGFIPGDANRIALGWLDTLFSDTTASGGTTHYYTVRSVDGTSGAEDDNLVRLAVIPSGPAADVTFASGAEPGDPMLDTSAGWSLSGTRTHAGSESFWSTAANNLCVSLTTPAFELTPGQSSMLSFWTVWDIEQGWDGGVVEVSTDGGAQWTRLTPEQGYPGTITQGGTLCGIAQGSGAFTGTGHFTWTQYDVDLSAYAGQTVQTRWLYRTDQGQAGEGWFVDDVALTHALVPGTCVVAPDAIFIDGFDSSPRR